MKKRLHKKITLMGILNLTPDSFSDGGLFLNFEKAMRRVEELKKEGADIIDIGAESTAGPKSQISAEEEWKRLEPVLKRINYKNTFVSVDTYKSSVAETALKLGVQMINDVTGLRGDSRMADVLLRYKPYVCLMHSAYDTPYAGNEDKHFTDIIAVIKEFLLRQTNYLLHNGFPREKIIIDPGLGRFLSNDPAVSWEVIDRLSELKFLGYPILIGPSRKGFLGGAMKDRDQKTREASKKCVQHGANILRVHDVKIHQKLLQ